MSKLNRYPGPKPFGAHQAHLFKGRSREAKRLQRMLENNQMSVLYGRSGYGKSSLLNAAVLPELQAQGYHLLNVRMGAFTPDSAATPMHRTIDALAENPKHLEPTILDDIVAWDNSLWYFTKTYAINSGHHKLLFVFDQFEELFTYQERDITVYRDHLAELLKAGLPQRYQDELTDKKAFADHAQREALFQRLDIKVVFGIRSSRFHLLERFSKTFPRIMRNTLELDALTREGARKAIVEPAADPGDGFLRETPFSYTPDAQKMILDFLSEEKRIEGILLQIVCSYFEKQMIEQPEKKEINIADLQLVSGAESNRLEAIVDQYYEDRIDALPDEDEPTVRRLIEDNLVQKVGDGGIRLNMHQEQIKLRFDLEPDILNTLVANGLLRTEPFLRGGVTYELTHDRLIAPVLRSKAEYDAGEADRLKAQLKEEERKRKAAEELRALAENARTEADTAREEAEQAQQKAELQREAALTAQRDAETARLEAETSARRARRFSYMAVALLLAAVALGVSSYFYQQQRLEEQAEKNLILCKSKLIDADQLLDAGYCQSARAIITSAKELIDLHGEEGSQKTCQEFDQQEERLSALQERLNQKGDDQCR